MRDVVEPSDIVEEFPGEEAAEALCFALAMLAASGFVPGKAEQQYDMALALNQVLSLVPWRMTSAA